jgi:hypothetical protein
VLDDVTMSQASLVTELHQANPTAGMAALVSGALRVGRDHIAATVNTLFLAYAGAALPSLILFVTGQNSLGTVATTELVAVEVVRALCGSVGLIAAVPLTTVLAALVATEEPSEVQARPSADGARSPEAATSPQPGPLVKGPEGRRGGRWLGGWGRRRQNWCWTVSLPSTAFTCHTPWSTSTAAAGWPPKTCRDRPGRPPPGFASWTPTPSGTHPGSSGPAPAAWSASTSATPRS